MPTNFFQRSAMAVAIAACFPATGYAAGVARVDFAVGNVTAQGADGRTRPLARGSEIEVGDTVNTQQGRAQLRFQDGAFMSLQPETAFKVEQFRFTENGAGSDNIVMNLLKGGMRTITGLIGRANRQNYKFRTEVATIGIRGTEYAVRYTNSIEVFCAGGSIEIENEGGTLVLGSGQGGFVQDPKQEPQRTEERPFLPPTAASGGQEPQEQIAPPVNPVQEARQPALLTGTFTGNYAVTQASGFEGTARIADGFETPIITIDPGGSLTSFADAFEGAVSGTTTVGTAQSVSAGNDGIIAWGRWVNGVTAGDGSFSGSNTSQDPLHYVVGLPVTNMPTTGVATYSMVGATIPTFTGSVTAATLHDSQIQVDFLNVSANYQFKMSVNWQGGNSATFATPNGGISLSTSGAHLSGGGSLVSTGSFVCFSSLNVDGFLSGPGAVRAGLVYNLSIDAGRVGGAIAHQLTSTAPSPDLRAQ